MNTDACARTVIPITIAAALDVSLARHIIIRIFHHDTTAAAGPIALAILVTDQANPLHKIGARVFTASIDVRGIAPPASNTPAPAKSPIASFFIWSSSFVRMQLPID
jgi:hypothetical protein